MLLEHLLKGKHKSDKDVVLIILESYKGFKESLSLRSHFAFEKNSDKVYEWQFSLATLYNCQIVHSKSSIY